MESNRERNREINRERNIERKRDRNREREREKEEIVRVKARREAIVKAGMSEVLSNYRRCDKSDLMGC